MCLTIYGPKSIWKLIINKIKCTKFLLVLLTKQCCLTRLIDRHFDYLIENLIKKVFSVWENE